MDLFAAEKHAEKVLYQVLAQTIAPGFKILEVGAGGGLFIKKLANNFKDSSFFAVDPYLEQSRRDNVYFYNLKAEQIINLKERFNIIFAKFCLHHFSNVPLFFQQAWHILNDKGICIILDWKKGTNTGIIERYFSLEEAASLMQRNFAVLSRQTYPYFFVIQGRK